MPFFRCLAYSPMRQGGYALCLQQTQGQPSQKENRRPSRGYSCCTSTYIPAYSEIRPYRPAAGMPASFAAAEDGRRRAAEGKNGLGANSPACAAYGGVFQNIPDNRLRNRIFGFSQ